jgi:hypothetical protein
MYTLWNRAITIQEIELYKMQFPRAATGSRCYVRLDFLWQFKTDLVRRLEGLVKKIKIIVEERIVERHTCFAATTTEISKSNKSAREREKKEREVC